MSSVPALKLFSTSICHPERRSPWRPQSKDLRLSLLKDFSRLLLPFNRIPSALILSLALLFLTACRTPQRDPRTVVFLIDSSPDQSRPPSGHRCAIRAHRRNPLRRPRRPRSQFPLHPRSPKAGTSPTPRPSSFISATACTFHDGRSLTSRDVAWTIDSMRNGTVISSKAQPTLSDRHHRRRRSAHRRLPPQTRRQFSADQSLHRSHGHPPRGQRP